MKVTVKVEGLKLLEQALRELPKATGKAVLRRTAVKGLTPFLASVKAKAPVDEATETPERPPGTLRDSYIIGTKLTRTQQRSVRREGKSSVEVYSGTTDPAGVLQEFGTVNHSAQPHVRPAWDETKDQALEIVGKELGGEIDRAAQRLARKAARLALKGG